MSSSLGYSLIEGSDKINKQALSKNNKTRRNKITKEALFSPPPRVEDSPVENEITAFSSDEDETDDFNIEHEKYPDRNPVSAGSERLDRNLPEHDNTPPNQENNNSGYNIFPINMNTNNPRNEGFENAIDSESELMQKLNYMIRLLEEQHDDKIKSVTEEIILFGFLGVFIIYVVDSFAKVGKYVR